MLTSSSATGAVAASDAGGARPLSRSLPWLPLAALLLLAALLRFPTIATQSIWFDEAATWELMRKPFGAMLSALPHRESNPPLFYVLEWGWVRVFGDHEFGIRSLAAVAGTLLVAVAFAIGRRIGGDRAGLAAAALVAVNPLLVWFSQEARNYELVALMSAVSLWLFLRALDDRRERAIAWWALASALALCTHYFACFVLAPQVVWLLWRDDRRRAVWASVGALALVALALLPMLLEQRGNPYDIAGASIGVRLLQIPKQFLLGYRGPAALPAGLLGAALIAGGAWLLARLTAPRVRERALLVGSFGLIGLLLPIAGALVGADYLNARNLLPALVPLAAALAAGFAADGPRRAPWLGSALLGTLCALSLAIVVTVAATQEYQRPDWKGLAAAIGDSPVDRAIVVSPANGAVALRFYRRELRPLPAAGAEIGEADTVAVASSPGPGDRPVLPIQAGLTLLPPGAFLPAQRTQTGSWVMLRWQRGQPGVVVPEEVASVHFGDRSASVQLLPASR